MIMEGSILLLKRSHLIWNGANNTGAREAFKDFLLTELHWAIPRQPVSRLSLHYNALGSEAVAQ